MTPKFLIDSNTLIYASKERDGEISKWIVARKPCLTDVSYAECLTNWTPPDTLEYAAQSEFLRTAFAEAVAGRRYIQTTEHDVINKRARKLHIDYNLSFLDALIAAAAEHFGLTLVTADVTKNFAPRLEKLNAEGLGAFRLRTYAYETREETFAKWNAESPG